MLRTILARRLTQQLFQQFSKRTFASSSSSANDDREPKETNDILKKTSSPAGEKFFGSVIHTLQNRPVQRLDPKFHSERLHDEVEEDELEVEFSGRRGRQRGRMRGRRSMYGRESDEIHDDTDVNRLKSKGKRPDFAESVEQQDLRVGSVTNENVEKVQSEITKDKVAAEKTSSLKNRNVTDDELFYFDFNDTRESSKSDEQFALEKIDELDTDPEKFEPTYDHVAPILGPSFNLASFVPRSQTLQELVKLGVELHEWDKKTNVAEAILMLDFERDIKPYVQFLTDVRVPPNALGRVFTKNPQIFREELENLKIRLNYLESKKFTPDMMAIIIVSFPQILSIPTVKVDSKLGFYQKTFQLTGDEIRDITVRMPKLIKLETTKFDHSQFLMKETFGFSNEEVKQIFLTYPKIWFIAAKSLERRFNVVHNMMRISHEMIVKFPQCFLCRDWKIKERHMFLVHLKKAQYNPTQDHYVCIKDLVLGTDSDFCENVAKVPVANFNEFLAKL